MTPQDGALGRALFDDQYIQDPYPLYERMHAHGPIHRIGHSDFYAVTGWEAVNEAVARCDDFSSNLTATMMLDDDGMVKPLPMGDLGGPTQVLATADDPAHAAHRKLLIPQLAAKRIRTIEPFIAEMSTHILGNPSAGQARRLDGSDGQSAAHDDRRTNRRSPGPGHQQTLMGICRHPIRGRTCYPRTSCRCRCCRDATQRIHR